MAQNGIQLKVRARVTVRANLRQLIGGATEETIIARVGEGIVSAIGSSKSHLEVLANPDRISKTVLARRLDAQTAFEIVSIDIADVDVGENIGARLQADQAEADMRVARANAEGRRAMAVAEEQEMIAQIEQNRAKVLEAEAQVPKAIAHAFNSGKLGLMDYYRLRNIQADTDMRSSIAKAGMTPDRQKDEQHGMNGFAPLLAAGLNRRLIQMIVILVIAALGALAKLIGKIQQHQRPPARGPQPAARPVAPSVANEIDEFMRRAAQRRAAEARRPAGQMPVRQPARPTAPAKPVQAEVVAESPIGAQITKQVETFSRHAGVWPTRHAVGRRSRSGRQRDQRTPASSVRSQRQQTGVGAGRNGRRASGGRTGGTYRTVVAGHPRHVRHRPDRPVGESRFRPPGDRFQRDFAPA